MGQKKILHMRLSDWLWCLVSTTLIGDCQNQSYLYLGTLIPFKLKARSYISSMYFSWKIWDSMGFGKCLFKLWRLELKKLSEFFPILSGHSSSPHSQQNNNCI
jgi:hypothetical protein